MTRIAGTMTEMALAC